MPEQDTSQQGSTWTDDETANADLLFGTPDEGSTPDSEVAQADGSVKDDAPTGEAPTATDGEMGEGEEANETDDAAAEGEKSTKTDEAATDDASDDLDPDVLAEAEAVGNAFLGDGNTEPAGDPVWQERTAAMTRKYNDEHRAFQESTTRYAEALSAVGYETVETADGLKLARVADFKDPRVDNFDANEAWANLSAAEKELYQTVDEDGVKSSGRDAFKVAYENGVRSFAESLPQATAKAADRIIPQSECDRVFSDFATKTLPNGKPMFPDCDKPEIQQGLQRVADSQDAVMLALREAATKDAAMYEAMLELAYNRHFRSTYERKALIARAKRQKLEQAKKDKQVATVPGTGGSTGDQQGEKSTAEKVEDQLGSWRGNTHAPDGTPYM